MRGIGFLRLALAVLLVIVVVVPVQASTISYTGSDTTTLGNWRTAAPDADAKYGTDGYVMLYYAQALNQGYSGDNQWNVSRDLAAVPTYMNAGYSYGGFSSNGGSDGGTNEATDRPSVTLEDPTTLTKRALGHIYGYVRSDSSTNMADGNLAASFTMASDKKFNLEIYAGHNNANLAWTQSYIVSVGSASASSDIIRSVNGIWQVFTVDAKAGDVVTVTANCQAFDAGTIMTAIAFDPVPEPSTIVLLSMGVIGLLAYAWRKRK